MEGFCRKWQKEKSKYEDSNETLLAIIEYTSATIRKPKDAVCK